MIVPIGGEDDYKKALTRKPNYVSQNPGVPMDDRVAGVRFRPKSGERSINEVFATGQSQIYIPQRGSLQTYDINGRDEGKNYS